MRIVQTVAPVVALYSIQEVKAHLRVEHSEDDAYIVGLIDVATSYLGGPRGATGNALINATYRAFVDDWHSGDHLHIPFGPIQSITSIAYWTTGTDPVTVSADDYELEGEIVRFGSGVSWPTGIRARVDLVAGYGPAAADVPMAIRQAGLLVIGHLYRSREAVGFVKAENLPFGVEALLAPYRRMVA